MRFNKIKINLQKFLTINNMKSTIDIELTLINGKVYSSNYPTELKNEEILDLFVRFSVTYTEDEYDIHGEVTKLHHVIFCDDYNKEQNADEETRKKVLEYLEYNLTEIILND